MMQGRPEQYKQHFWHIGGGRTLALGCKARLMGIINATPDSFSDGGAAFAPAAALRQAKAMLAAGADILDIGGESTRPGGEAVGESQEQQRILPIIKACAEYFPAAILSVDTYHAATAEAALKAGAHIINDVYGLRKDPAMADLAAVSGAGLVIMHTGRERQKHPDALMDQRLFLARSLEIAAKAGVKREQIVLDPGFGFAKTLDENLTLLRHAAELQQFGLPLLAGTSRKGFLGKISGEAEPAQRDGATAASSALLRMAGFAVFRVHNVALNVQALNVADAVLGGDGGAAGASHEARAWLSLGGNQGGAEAHFRYALAQLKNTGCGIRAVSSLYQTPAWGKTDQADFSNICVEITTALTPHELLALCLKIEKQRGRERREKWGARSLDIDIIAYENYISPVQDKELILPHPYAAERAFVMLPLAEIAPHLSLSGKMVAQWAAELEADGAAAGIKRRESAAVWAADYLPQR